FADVMSALPGADATVVRKRRWQTSPVAEESTKETVKTIACGNAGRFRCTRCYSCAFYRYNLHTRPRVQRASGIPHALFGRKIHVKPRAYRAARAKPYAGPYQRHCEERKRRSNQYFLCGKMYCFD